MKYEWSFGAATFKRRLVLLMDEKGLSQQAVADFSGVSQGTVSRWLSGSRPELENVTSLASKTGVPFSWLAHGEGHLKIAYRGVDGFIHRAKSRLIPRLKDVLDNFSVLQDADFLPPEEREIVEDIYIKLRGRLARLSACVDALEKLPPNDDAVVNEILAKYKPTPAQAPTLAIREEMCLLLALSFGASDEDILGACRAILKKNPKAKAPQGKSIKPPRPQV